MSTVNNSITLISKYLPLLDRKYQMESKTAILDLPSSMIQETMDAKSVLIPSMVLNGLADYGRNGGYTMGDVNLTWQTHTFTQDRGRMFLIDTMDELETAFVLYANVSGEFIRLHVAPELDAYRLSRYAFLAGNSAAGSITTANILQEFVKARTALINNHVPADDLIMFASADVYGTLMLANDLAKTSMVQLNTPEGIQLEITSFNNTPIIEVPADRMMTEYEFYDGTTSGQSDGGFKPASGAKKINFIMMSRSSAMQIVKRATPKIISPEANQNADGWLFGYRIYHDAFVNANQKAAIYAHKEN